MITSDSERYFFFFLTGAALDDLLNQERNYLIFFFFFVIIITTINLIITRKVISWKKNRTSKKIDLGSYDRKLKNILILFYLTINNKCL